VGVLVFSQSVHAESSIYFDCARLFYSRCNISPLCSSVFFSSLGCEVVSISAGVTVSSIVAYFSTFVTLDRGISCGLRTSGVSFSSGKVLVVPLIWASYFFLGAGSIYPLL